MLGQIERELSAQELDRLSTGERELGCGNVEHGSRQPPPREAAELWRPSRGEHQVGVIRQQIDELVAEGGERSATANARMVVDEEGERPQTRELVRECLRKLCETPLEAAPAIQKGRELLAELRGVASQSTDQIREQDQRIFVAAPQGEPRRAPAGGA